ncbi:MAG: 3-phosphoshikimate 1-carboxyvinyltransferase [Planctomycetota bacterium]|jgi:3-phosphoshikimate 1-carboxyvinyltransferase
MLSSAPSSARLEFVPGTTLSGSGRAPGSKSIAQRALVIAAWAHGTTLVRGLPDGRDVRAARAWANGLAGLPEGSSGEGEADAEVELRQVDLSKLRLRGVRPGRPWNDAVARVDESGTLARLVTAVSALTAAPHPIEVQVAGSLRRRRSPALVRALERAGARLTSPRHPATWPLRIRPVRCPFALRLERPSSSQELSALGVAAAAWGGRRSVTWSGALPSRPYAEMTWNELRGFGVAVDVEDLPDGGRVHLNGRLRSPGTRAVEPDASSAAVLLAAAAITGGELTIEGLGSASAQGDVRITRASTERLFAKGAPTRAAQLDLSDTPDLAPVVAAVAATLALRSLGPARLTGLGTLRGKESDRVAVLARGLRALGLSIGETRDSLEIAPGEPTAGPVEIAAQGDHRMVFAFALLSLVRPGLAVRGAEAAAKSWPGFAAELERLGAVRRESETSA